jgi:tripartite-type tricarboxylate transporter receptor subunit TctC
MSGGLSRRAAVLAPVAMVARSAFARRSTAIAAASAVAGVLGGASLAAAWPAQPIRLVVPFAPGGSTDLAARVVAHGLGERLGQPIVVENRPGAGATLGSALVAAAAPDGHTLVMSNVASHAIAPALYPNLRYDPLRDFTHVGLITANPSAFVSNPRFAARGLSEVARLSMETPRGLDVASYGSGSSNHLLIVQFAQAAPARLNHVPYRGAGPAMTDVIAGVVPLMSDSLPSAAGHIRAGSVRAIGLSSPERHPAFPAVPTFREQGVDLVSTSWFGLSGPAGLPAPVLARLERELDAVLKTPSVRDRLAEVGGQAGALSSEEYTAFVRSEAARWEPLVRASGATVE